MLVLSVFPGIDLLGLAFEQEGFTVVRGPDPIWGGDVKTFHPPAGRFDGVIGGPPCQIHSRLRFLNPLAGQKHGDLIPEFCRVVAELTARALRQAHHVERLRAGKGGGATAVAAERERAALIGFLRRFLLAFGDRDGAWDEGLLARASTQELDRLVGVALTVLSHEAHAK